MEPMIDPAEIAAPAKYELTDQDRSMLDLAADYPDEAQLLNAVHALQMPATWYFAKLRQLIRTEAALAYDPVTVRRLDRTMTAHTKARRPYWEST
ncbi:DUF3263 domain-containing protein [Actinoplanes sp. URMC 104]|uniref:DUF3263 domain-containing protein n=1 Tax=Actinoplanes sp. URMC 104 TaxID=3423409 RepID=UPI003F1A4087